MKSSLKTLLIGLIVVVILAGAGYFIVKRFIVSADVPDEKADSDLNKDGKVDLLDLNLLIKAVGDKSENPKFDLDRNGQVNSLDINVLMKNIEK